MTLRQKIATGLGFSLFLFGMFFVTPHKAAAAEATDIRSATLTAKNAGTITLSIGSQEIDFVDKNPSDPDASFTAKVDGCSSSKITLPDKQTNFAGKVQNMTASIDLHVQPKGGGCIDANPNPSKIALKSTPNIYAFFNWVSADTVQSIDGAHTYKNDGSGQFLDTAGGQCADRVVFAKTGGGASFYDLTTNSSDAIPASVFTNDLNAQGCYVKAVNFHGNLCSTSGTAVGGGSQTTTCNTAAAQKIAGDRLDLIGSATDPVANLSTSDVSPTCESSNHTGFEWIFCGVIGAVDDFINQIGDVIESQLVFDTNNDFGDDQGVRQAWAALKNIATIMVVIVALVMVISQIVSWGPFDAYTIKRVLPRLIIAIIAIQLSWYLLSWFIELANDAGQGIANLLYAPFGGRHALSLATLLDNNVGAGTSTGLFTAAAIGGAIGIAIMNIFGIAALALGAFAAILVGFLVLVFRKILIIMCVILAPVAIICWVLPNTQKYWKLWHETFSKLLIMFPLVVALIASGRIFAHVAGSSDTNPILTFFLIVVGFFGPFFILPKTFQWGGRALGTLSGITNDRGKGALDRSRKFLGERQQQRKAWGAHQASEDLLHGRHQGIRGRTRQGINAIRTGRADPTKRWANPMEADAHARKISEQANKFAFRDEHHAEEERKLEVQRNTHAGRHEATMRNLDAQELSAVQELNVQTAKFDLSGIGSIGFDQGNVELSSIATSAIGSTRTFINPDGSTRTGQVTAEHVAQAADMMRSRSLIGDYTDPTSGTTQAGLRSVVNGLRAGTPDQQNLASKIINEHPGDIKAVAADLMYRQPNQLGAQEIATQDISTLRNWGSTPAVAQDRGNQAALRSLRLSDDWGKLSIEKRQVIESTLSQTVTGQLDAAAVSARAAAGTLASDITGFGGYETLKPQELEHIINTAAATPGTIPPDVAQGARVEMTSRRRQGAIV